jgi:hypothetical protein
MHSYLPTPSVLISRPDERGVGREFRTFSELVAMSYKAESEVKFALVLDVGIREVARGGTRLSTSSNPEPAIA